MHTLAKRSLLVLGIGMAAALMAGCSAPAATPTSTHIPFPTSKPTLEATEPQPEIAETAANITAEPGQHPATQSTNVVYQTADNQLLGYITGTGETWAFGGSDFAIQPGPNSTITTLDTNIYVVGGPTGEAAQVYLISPVGVMPVYSNPPYTPAGIAVTVDPADPAHPLMAVGEYDPASDPLASRLSLIWLDSDQTQAAAAETSVEGWYFMPWRWSADAARLYFSEEPMGLGGYILFDGYTTLYAFDRASGTTTTLIAADRFNQMICLDDLSPDERLAAHHCAEGGQIGLLDLQTNEDAGSISPPPEIAEQVGAVGSARFSPDGSRVAFALARRNPDDEQGWVAVSDGLAGAAQVVMESAAGSSLSVSAWLDASTLVVQEMPVGGSPRVWLVRLDGSAPQLLGAGVFLALIPPME